jgi:hypothetical protein
MRFIQNYIVREIVSMLSIERMAPWTAVNLH